MAYLDRFEFQNKKKGFNGTILVIGGSKMYTGAPYFSALASFQTGSDMVYIFSDSDSINPLKVLLPEAIVMDYSYEEWILKRVNVCIFGPGLGRPNHSQLCVIKSILYFLARRNIKIIVDGDGIRIASELNIFNFKNLIFTPNANEMVAVPELKEEQYLIRKGEKDVVESINKEIVVEEPACQKRIGGQGDILNGILATLLSKIKGESTEEDIILCLKLSSIVLRRAGNKAFSQKGISLLTRDILEEIPKVFFEVLTENE
ncbi:ATP-dependent (S)-NAD(P)H-hydrate dehydratase [Nosema granulosis]|uniref:ATP-dependent (S)-NAD(P)H-hydrate dehydratase n=1 Tax=Nosema granulosis TaxID=83296 RepID=A0A9P6H0Y6_9MICR|nr:ATP-dependent (S)-NAD(P)H-hydrate dehydratase [Nosema granulosis]